MPTVLLLDRSLSMKRPVLLDNKSETRLTLAKSGLTAFLSYLEHTFPLEQVSLMTFSSTCDVIVPFSRDHQELKECLQSITIGDKTDLCNTLKVVIDTVVKEWGVFNPIQIILVTDGTLGIDSEKMQLCIPFPCKLHVALIATREEFDQCQERIELLCQVTDTLPASLTFPTCSRLTTESVQEAFLQLCQTHYQPFTSILKCGHLESKISFSPSPMMVQSLHDVATTPKHVFKNPYTITDFPSEISICGFLDIRCLSAPGVYSKHYVIDADPDVPKANKLVKLLLNDQPIEDEKRPESDKPSFRVLLHGSLKCESKVALVKLG